MSDVARNAILEGKPLPGHLNASVIWNKPICNSKGHGIPRATFILYCFTLSGTELVTCVQVCPCPGWVQFEILRNPWEMQRQLWQ